MDKKTFERTDARIHSPDAYEPRSFSNAEDAVAALVELYRRNTSFLTEAFKGLSDGVPPGTRFRAYYPQISLYTASFGHIDSRLSYGHVTQPGH